jgi:hypothetical protein
MGLIPEVVEVEFVDKALNGQVDLSSLLAAGDAVAYPDDVHTLQAEPVVQP